MDVQYLPKEIAEDLVQKEESNKREAEEANGEPAKKKFKAKGRFKNRPRDKRPNMSEKVCMAIVQGRDCRFGDTCKFLHDLKKYTSNKPPNLGEKCYVYETYGYCPFGVTCLYSSRHLTTDFENIKNEEKYEEGVCANSNVLNCVERDLQIRLRRKQYDFKASEDTVKEVVKMNFDSSGAKPSDVKVVSVDSIKSSDVKGDEPVAMGANGDKLSSVNVDQKVIHMELNGSMNGNTEHAKAESQVSGDLTSVETDMASEKVISSANGNGTLKGDWKPDTGIDLARIRPGEKKTVSEQALTKVSIDYSYMN